MKKYWNIFTDKFGDSIIHPQFIMLSKTRRGPRLIKKYLKKNATILDIGPGRMRYRDDLVRNGFQYHSLDHPSLYKLYDSNIRPDFLVDVNQKLPLKSNSYDAVCLFQLLEYLDNPEKTFKEIYRILKPKGWVFVTSPFLYPIHDFDYDKNRFTQIRILNLLENTKLKIIISEVHGNFFEFWFQSLIIFLFRKIMNFQENKDWKFWRVFLSLICIFFITPFVVLINLLSLISRSEITNQKNIHFPLNYLFVARKN